MADENMRDPLEENNHNHYDPVESERADRLFERLAAEEPPP